MLNFVEDVMTAKLLETVYKKHFRMRIAFPLSLFACLVFGLAMLVLAPSRATAQTGGEGGIQGTIVDATGAVIPNAVVTATNVSTGVSTTRQASRDGYYTISPIIPGTYTVSATAQGFGGFKQENFSVNAMKLTGLNITLAIGDTSAEVTVTEAPPQLETTNATLGGVMENSTYQNLPILMGGQQRDATAFASLMPGAQPGARTPIIAGTGNYLAEISLDGIPITTSNQQGDNRVIFNSVPVDAVDQFQVLTSTPPAEYQGAGLLNFTIKSGGNQYHGTAADFVRNTAFDTWGFSAPALMCPDPNNLSNKIQCKKPVEHQNELVGTVGGPIPFLRHKGFFFAAYDRYHGRAGVNPNTLTVPTANMRTGDFSELIAGNRAGCTPGTAGCAGQIYDPTTQATCTANSTTGPCRYQYGYGPSGTPGPAGNPILNGLPVNAIPKSEQSPISLYNAQWLPAPTNTGLTNNFLGGVGSGYDNWEMVARGDYDLTASQRLSLTFTMGTRANKPYSIGNNGVVLPFPYAQATYATVKPTIATLEHSIILTPRLSNQFRYGFVNMGGPPIKNITDGVAPYRSIDSGITGLPAGQASNDFAASTFGTSTAFATAISQWQFGSASGASQTSVADTYTLKDNLLYVRGQHSMTFGFQYQWLDDNASTEDSGSYSLTAAYNPVETSNFNANGSSSNASLNSPYTGFSYASFLLGAVSSSSETVQPFSVLGGRFHPFAPYFQDDWKITPKLTLNLGLRWDYMPPFHEVQDRWSFLNPTMTNPVSPFPGALQFAGNRGAGISCMCKTPVQTYWKNWGPRIGAAYAVTNRTVIRGGFAVVYSHAGGTGGRAGAAVGTGQAGFNATTSFSEVSTGATAGPAFYLNNGPAFTTAGIANTNYGGLGVTPPVPQAPSATSAGLNAGNYYNGSTYVSPSSIGYADPYYSGRAPEFIFYNLGMQQSLTNSLTLSINYAGSESHFVVTGGSNLRGYWANQLDPVYYAGLGGATVPGGTSPLLTAQATAANIAAAQAIMPSIKTPPMSYIAAAAAGKSATIAQMLVAFPQYSSVTDTWGQNGGNMSYNSLQVTLNQREWKGLSYTVNFTWSKNMGDDGTFRSGFNIPGTAISNGKSYHQDRIERSLTLTDVPRNVSIFGVYALPFGKGHIGGDHFLVRTLASGWQLSSIYQYRTGVPLAITTTCTAVGQGTCMPDMNRGFSGSAHTNGNYGAKMTAAQLGTIPYINVNAFSKPAFFNSAQSSPLQLIGSAPRTGAYGLRNPNYWNDDASIRRTFNLTAQNRVNLVIGVDCTNIFNHPTLGGINTTWSATSTTFGSVGSASGFRAFQFSGRINF